MTHSLHPKYFYTQPATIGSSLLGKGSRIGGQSKMNEPKFGSTAASAPVIQKPISTHGDGEAMVYEAIHQAILNPKYIIQTEFASNIIDSRSAHQYDKEGRFVYDLPNPEGFLGGSHFEIVKLGKRFFARDIGQSDEAINQGLYYMDSAPLIPTVEALADKEDPGALDSFRDMMMDTNGWNDNYQLFTLFKSKFPLSGRYFQPLKNGDHLFLGGHLMEMKGLPKDSYSDIHPLSEKATYTPQKTQAEALKQIDKVLDIISSCNAKAELIPGSTKILNPGLMQLRIMVEPEVLKRIETRLVEEYTFPPEQAASLVNQIRTQAKDEMRAFFRIRDKMDDVSRKPFIVNPDALPSAS